MAEKIMAEEIMSLRYSVKDFVYPGCTIYTIMDSDTGHYIYGQDNQVIVEKKCDALNGGLIVDLTQRSLFVRTSSKSKNNAQVTMIDIDENSS